MAPPRLTLPGSFLAGAFAVACGADSHDASTSGGVGASSRVWSGTASMLFDGASCTHEADAKSDRWCGFVALSSTNEQLLFVVNVTQVAAGIAVDCAAPDQNCVLLTTALGGDNLDPTHHGTLFQGDTLVYYDDSLTPYAWRPGMASGRKLADASATLDLIFCRPASQGTALACLALPAEQPDEGLARGELLLGKADGAIEPLLTTVDQIIMANVADRGGVARFGYGFPAVAGDYLAWTSRETAEGPEILKVQRADDSASQRTVASDVHGWDVSADGEHWFWLSAIDKTGVGMLQTAPFPDGAEPSDVQPSVIEYGVAKTGGRTLVTVSQLGELTAIADAVDAPDTRIGLDSKVQKLLSFTDKGHVAYIKRFVGTTLSDLFVSNVNGTGSCALDTTTNVPFVSLHFSSDSDSAIWALAKGESFDALHTRLSDCSTASIAPDVAALAWLGRDVIVFMDDFDADAGRGSLRFRSLDSEQMLEPETSELIAHDVDTYAISGPDPGTLLYTVNAGGAADGVYVRWFSD